MQIAEVIVGRRWLAGRHNTSEQPGAAARLPGQVAARSIDGSVSTKWSDVNFTSVGSSLLELTLASTTVQPIEYELVTANDHPARDPVSWTAGVLSAGVRTPLSSISNFLAPEHRQASYGRLSIIQPPPSPPPPSPPAPPYAQPPSAPMHRAITFRFTNVRTGPFDGIQLGAIALIDVNGRLLTIDTIANPGGDSPRMQQAQRLIDYQTAQHATDASVAQILAKQLGQMV